MILKCQRFIIVAIAFGVLSCTSERNDNHAVMIFYIPFELNIYGNVTTDTIDVAGVRSGRTLDKTSQFQRLLVLLESASPGEFDNRDVRAKIVMHNRVIFIDVNGNVRDQYNGDRKLALDEIAEIGKILEDLTDPA